MKSIYKYILSICIAFVMSLAFVVGYIGNNVEKDNVVTPNNPPVESKITWAKQKTYTFKEGEVSIQKGSDQIDFSYNPDVNSQSGGTIAYEYVFNNSMATEMAIGLKEITDMGEGVTVSYAYSDTKLDPDDIDSSESLFEAQRVPANSTKYIYVVVSGATSNYSSSVVWYQGEAGDITLDVNGKQYDHTIVKGQQIGENTLYEPVLVENCNSFDGWFTDEECKTAVNTTTRVQYNTILYAKVPNISADYLQYDSSTDSYYVKRYAKLVGESTEVVVPSTYNGKPVTSIADNAFQSNTSITSVTLPNTITSIGEYAFYECNKLTTLYLEGCTSLTVIESYVFMRCTALTNIYLPTTIQYIGASVFSGCDNLLYNQYDNAYYLGNKTKPYLVLVDVVNTTIISCAVHTDARIIYDGAFQYCGKITSMDLTKCINLVQIGISAFSSCSELKSITFPNSLIRIEESAISGNMTSIVIPASVMYIGKNAFAYCEKLTSISVESGNTKYNSYNNCNAIIETDTKTLLRGCVNTLIPSDIKVIGMSAFRDTYEDTNITIMDLRGYTQLTTIEDEAFFGCVDLTQVIIPYSVTSIGESVFARCSLTSISVASGNTVYDSRNNCNAIIKTEDNQLVVGCGNTIVPTDIESIGDYAFAICKELTSLDLSKCSNLTNIYNLAFWQCYRLTSIKLPNSITYIGIGAFNGCTALTSITLPNNLNKISTGAFRNCTRLTSITFEDTGYYWSVNNNDISVYDSSTNATNLKSTYTSYEWTKTSKDFYTNLSSDWYTYDSSIGGYKVVNGGTVTGDILVAGTYQKGSYPEAPVKVISDRAFYNCTNLSRISLPSSLTSIGNHAFRSCTSLSNIDLSGCDSLTSIGLSAFESCTSLSDITIPAGVTNIGGYAFNNCTNLSSVDLSACVRLTMIDTATFNNTGLSSIDLSGCTGLTHIAFMSFQNCTSLSSIVIPSSVTKIGNYVFYKCDNLSSITFASGGTWYYTTSDYTGGNSFTIVANTNYANEFVTNKCDYYWYKI